MYITREEFGLDLFDAIKCIGGLLAIQDQVNASVYQGKKLDELVARRDRLRKDLTALMVKLDDKDVAEITKRYPMVAML